MAQVHTRTVTGAELPVYDLGAEAPRDVRRLRAFEIWGGSEAGREHLQVPGFDAWLYSSPHAGHGVGGDLRFVSTCAAGQIVRFTLADLAGHGAEASELAARLHELMRKHMNTPNPMRFARKLNTELTREADAGRFATAVIQTYFCPTDHLIVCNAGHPRPLIYRAADKAWELFDEHSPGAVRSESAAETGVANLPLGILAPTTYPVSATHLRLGDIVISYTDAIIEAKAPDGSMLGEDGLLNLVRGFDVSDPGAIGDVLLARISEWREGAPADDDETILVLHHTGSNPPDTAWARFKALGRLVGIVK